MPIERALNELEKEIAGLKFQLWVARTTPRERAIYYNGLSREYYRGKTIKRG